MEKKITVRSAALIAAASALLTFSVTSFWAFRIWSDSTAELRNKAESVEEMYNVNHYISKYYYGDYDQDAIIDASLKAMVGALGDKYSAYMTEDEYEQTLINAKGSIKGIGVVVNLSKDNEMTVVGLTEDAPAAKAGMLEGDVIVKINGEDIREMEYSDAVKLIRGEEGTEVSLGVLRDGNELEFNMVRENIVTKTVAGSMLENNIGYIRISSFKDSTTEQFNKELDRLMEDNPKALIFDVRNNGGGLVSACEKCLDPLLPEGDIALAEFKDGKTEVICRSDADELNIPMAVLINGNTASAAELFAASLKDFGKATLIGENSFGKGIMQSTYSLDHGNGIKLTVAKYRTVKSQCYQGVGLPPDDEVKMPEKYGSTPIEDIPHGEDAQLAFAVNKLIG